MYLLSALSALTALVTSFDPCFYISVTSPSALNTAILRQVTQLCPWHSSNGQGTNLEPPAGHDPPSPGLFNNHPEADSGLIQFWKRCLVSTEVNALRWPSLPITRPSHSDGGEASDLF